jgi:hypothetical protein
VTGFGLLALLLADAAAPPPARVVARPTKTEVTVGETFQVEVQAEGPAGTAWTFPAEIVDERIELRLAPAGSPAPAGAPDRPRYDAAVFALKDVAVPPITARYRLRDGTEGEATTEAVPIRVVSLLPKDPKEQALADIRPPVGLRVGGAFWTAVAVVVLALAGLVIWLVRRRRAPTSVAPPAPVLAPDQEALAALGALFASDLLARGAFRPFYIELTLLAKRYLERRLAAPVVEMTFAEMAAFLRDHPHGQPFLPALKDLSTAADQIKFARGDGQAAEAERHAGAVRELIAGLEARLTPPPLPAPPGGGTVSGPEARP